MKDSYLNLRLSKPFKCSTVAGPSTSVLLTAGHAKSSFPSGLCIIFSFEYTVGPVALTEAQERALVEVLLSFLIFPDYREL